jgi:hypothetical protein
MLGRGVQSFLSTHPSLAHAPTHTQSVN